MLSDKYLCNLVPEACKLLLSHSHSLNASLIIAIPIAAMI